MYDSLGFENPPYSAGNLEGQEGWQGTAGNLGTAEVQTSVVAGGSQAVQVNRVAGGDDRWGQILGSPLVPSEQFICITWDMLVEQTVSADFGPFFGVEVFDDSIGPVLRLAMLGVDATTGDVLYGDSVTGLSESGSLVNFDEWNTFGMDLNFTDETYSISLNGSELLTTGFEFPGAAGITDVDLAALAASLTGGNLTGTAFFDNLVIVETASKGAEPVPDGGATFALLGLGLAGVVVMKRRKTA